MWYVIWTTTGKEAYVKGRIEQELPMQYYERCFIPMKNEYRKYQGAWKIVEKALFPGYLFVETQYVEKVHQGLKSMLEFTKILRTEEGFSVLNSEEEDTIHGLIGRGNLFDVSRGIIENQRVTVTSGPLMGMEGIIRRINRHKRKAYLEVKMFGRAVDINVGLEIVEKA